MDLLRLQRAIGPGPDDATRYPRPRIHLVTALYDVKKVTRLKYSEIFIKSFRLALAFATFIFASSVFSMAQTDVAALYKSKCQGCHGADGTGNTPMGKKVGARDFHAPEVSKQSDEELFDITKKGKNKMPAY